MQGKREQLGSMSVSASAYVKLNTRFVYIDVEGGSRRDWSDCVGNQLDCHDRSSVCGRTDRRSIA